MIVLTIVRSHLKSPHPVDQLIAPVGDYLDSARDWLWRDLGGFAIVIIGCVFIGMAVVMTLLATIVLTVVGGIVGSWMEPWEPLLLHELTARVWDGFYALPYIANGALGLGIAWVVLRPLVVGIKQTDKWELHTK
jgi:hypothetical protein